MKMADIKVDGEYVILVPTRVRVVSTGILMNDGKGGAREAGVVVEQTDGGILSLVRCDTIKDRNEVPFHRLRLA